MRRPAGFLQFTAGKLFLNSPDFLSDPILFLQFQGLYTLRIVSGDRSGKNRVSSAEIRLNGSLVAGPNRFNQQVREIVVPVSLLPDNTISAQLQGAPRGQLTVTIEPQN